MRPCPPSLAAICVPSSSTSARTRWHTHTSSFDTPLAFSNEELEELRGTTLHKAAASVARRLQETWARLEPALAAIARDLGLPRPSLEDLAWAHCVFWSRGQGLPLPQPGGTGAGLGCGPAGRALGWAAQCTRFACGRFLCLQGRAGLGGYFGGGCTNQAGILFPRTSTPGTCPSTMTF